MASIYDIARLQSGDPMGQVNLNADMALAELNKYKREADMVREYNKALKEAEKKAKKGKLSGLGGSILGGLLSAGSNFLFPGAQTILGPLMSGIGAGVAEKYRQEKYDATGELKDLKEKYKGRAIADDIGDTIEAFEESQDSALTNAFITNLAMEALMPSSKTKEVESIEATAGDAIKDDQLTGGFTKEQLEELYNQGYEWSEQDGVTGLAREAKDLELIGDITDGSKIQEIYPELIDRGLLSGSYPQKYSDLMYNEDGVLGFTDFIPDAEGNMIESFVPYEPVIDMSLLDETGDFIPTFDAISGERGLQSSTGQAVEGYVTRDPNTFEVASPSTTSYDTVVNKQTEFFPGINQEAIDLVPQLENLDDYTREKLGKGLTDLKMLNNPIVAGLIRNILPQVGQRILNPQLQTYKASMPQFFNPYRRR